MALVAFGLQIRTQKKGYHCYDNPHFQYFTLFLGWKMGLEPTTLGTTILYSNQLSYIHHLDLISQIGCKYIAFIVFLQIYLQKTFKKVVVQFNNNLLWAVVLHPTIVANIQLDNSIPIACQYSRYLLATASAFTIESYSFVLG